jgi:hypothetical protein
VAFQTHKLGGSSLIPSEKHMKGIHLILINFSEMSQINYTTSKVDTIGGNPKSVKFTSGEINLRCADLGITPIRWQTNNLWQLPKRSNKK